MMQDPLPVPAQPLTTGGTILLVVLCAMALLHAAWLYRMNARHQAPRMEHTITSVVVSLFTLVTTGAAWDELQSVYQVVIAIMVLACLSMMRVIRMALNAWGEEA